MVSRKKGINKKVKIGANIRIYESTPSGIQNFIRGLFTTLITKYPTYEFTFFSTGKKQFEKKASYVTAKSSIISFIRKINPLLVNIFFDNLYILKLIYPAKLNIFIGSSYILPLFKPRNTKYITIIYDLSYLRYEHTPFKLYLNLVMYMKCVVPLVLKRADVIVVPSHFVKYEIEKKYHTSAEKLVVVYGGRDEYFHQITDKKKYDELRRKYLISEEYCFTNATNHERKNITGLVEAFRMITDKKIELIITGLLPESAIIELKNHINRQGLQKRVKFLGFVTKEDLRLLYSNARVFIFPSFEEGFGFPVLEAAACGCLPICSDTGSLPELIGQKQLTFNPRNVQSITRKINTVLSLTEKEYADELARVVSYTKQFTWSNTAEQYHRLFQKLLV